MVFSAPRKARHSGSYLPKPTRYLLGSLVLIKFRWVPGLGQTLQQGGLSLLNERFLPINDDIAHPWTLQHLMASVELINVIDRPPGNPTALEWWSLYDRAAAEVQRGASMRMGMVSVVGQLPLHATPARRLQKARL